MDIFAEVHYRRLHQIGVGQGMNSVVYLAEDPRLDRTIAVKEVDRARVSGSALADFYNEARTMCAAQHSHVVPVHYACETPDHIGIAMPYFAQGSLHDRIRSGPLSVREVIRIGQGVLQGLSQVHIAGIIHFDLKPTNVLFSDRDEPLVADFGQARLMDTSGVAAVPPLYMWGMPPEALVYGTGSVESDVYQAGLTLYRAMNGDPFFRAQLPPIPELRDAILHGRFPRRDRFLEHVPDALRRVVRKALQPAPQDRYDSATAFADALGRVDLVLDWTYEGLVPAGERWRAERPGQPALSVEKRPSATAGRFDVEVYTDRNGERRRKGVAEFWRKGLRPTEAQRHVRSVLSRLE